MIASGPTVPDSTTFSDALDVIKRYDLIEKTPRNIINHLEAGIKGQVAETPKYGDSIFDLVHNQIIGTNMHAVQGAITKAKSEGFHTQLLSTNLVGEARIAGEFLAEIHRSAAIDGDPISRPSCMIAGGETTVTLKHPFGLGGRNQELALAAVRILADLPDIAFISIATDGIDGSTDAAGAVVTGKTMQRATRIGLIPEHFLAQHDSYHFFDRLGDLLKPGSTQTNVNDLVFLFSF